MLGMLCLIAGLALIAAGLDGAHTREGRASLLLALLPIPGLALAAAGVLALCVPGFFTM